MEFFEWLGGTDGVEGRLRVRALEAPYPAGLRARAWLVLVGAGAADPEEYGRLLARGPAGCAPKIARDAHRTFRGDAAFGARVGPGALTRVLNAAMHVLDAEYIQGMNALCGVLVYVGGELLALALFRRLYRLLPTYLDDEHGLIGCAAGCVLIERVLAIVDAELLEHLRGRGMTGPLLGYGTLLSLGAALRPLEEVVRLWDFLLAFSPALMPVVVVARLLLARSSLLRSQNPLGTSQSLRLDARACILKAVALFEILPADLVVLLASHVHDVSVCHVILGDEEEDEEEETGRNGGRNGRNALCNADCCSDFCGNFCNGFCNGCNGCNGHCNGGCCSHCDGCDGCDGCCDCGSEGG